VRLDHLTHVVVLVFNLHLNHRLTITLVEEISCGLHQGFLLGKTLIIVIPNDVFELSRFHGAFHPHEVVKAFVSLGKFWALENGQQVVIFHANEDGVEHNALSSARVYIEPVHQHFCTCGVEGFILQLPDFAAINRESEICAKGFHVKVIHAAPNFLIWGKSHFNRPMWDFWVGNQGSHSGHDFRNTSLVICAEQGSTVGCYQSLPHVLV